MKPMYHIGFDDSHKAKYAILPGDPGRVERIAALLTSRAFSIRTENTPLGLANLRAKTFW